MGLRSQVGNTSQALFMGGGGLQIRGPRTCNLALARTSAEPLLDPPPDNSLRPKGNCRIKVEHTNHDTFTMRNVVNQSSDQNKLTGTTAGVHIFVQTKFYPSKHPLPHSASVLDFVPCSSTGNGTGACKKRPHTTAAKCRNGTLESSTTCKSSSCVHAAFGAVGPRPGEAGEWSCRHTPSPQHPRDTGQSTTWL